MKEIYLAGGCFWGIQEYYRRKDGIEESISGYANGTTENPSYQEVCSGTTGHAESVKLVYDEDVISLDTILDKFFRIHNPTEWMRQGFDVGPQYRSGIFYVDEDDLAAITTAYKEAQKRFDKPIVTEVKELKNFYEAEEYHQDYLVKNPKGYCHVDMDI